MPIISASPKKYIKSISRLNISRKASRKNGRNAGVWLECGIVMQSVANSSSFEPKIVLGKIVSRYVPLTTRC